MSLTHRALREFGFGFVYFFGFFVVALVFGGLGHLKLLHRTSPPARAQSPGSDFVANRSTELRIVFGRVRSDRPPDPLLFATRLGRVGAPPPLVVGPP